MKKPKAILCSDIHLRDNVPVCRIDNYWEAQERKINYISELQKKYNCPVLCAGDLFDKPRSSPFLESWTIKNLPDRFYSIAGQHDLPNHNILDMNKSSFGVLHSSEKIEFPAVFNGTGNNPSLISYNWNEKIKPVEFFNDELKIAIIHIFVQCPNDEQDKIIGGYSAKSLMNKLKEFDLILTGDNHKTFIIQNEKQILVNPGSMMRMTVGQKEHKPSVFLWYGEIDIEQVFLPIERDVISDEHVIRQKDKEDRMNSFVMKMNNNYELSLSFEKNLENYFQKNKIRKPIQNICWEVINE